MKRLLGSLTSLSFTENYFTKISFNSSQIEFLMLGYVNE
tara:strand:- start:12610 stop:12726 length:117 start_codon:yes stop_codon:yes gene_type:complete